MKNCPRCNKQITHICVEGECVPGTLMPMLVPAPTPEDAGRTRAEYDAAMADRDPDVRDRRHLCNHRYDGVRCDRSAGHLDTPWYDNNKHSARPGDHYMYWPIGLKDDEELLRDVDMLIEELLEDGLTDTLRQEFSDFLNRPDLWADRG
jgi:hypothetical protein